MMYCLFVYWTTLRLKLEPFALTFRKNRESHFSTLKQATVYSLCFCSNILPGSVPCQLVKLDPFGCPCYIKICSPLDCIFLNNALVPLFLFPYDSATCNLWGIWPVHIVKLLILGGLKLLYHFIFSCIRSENLQILDRVLQLGSSCGPIRIVYLNLSSENCAELTRGQKK